MPDDAHDGQWDPNTLRWLIAEIKNADVPSNWVLSGKILLRETVVDDHHALRVFIVALPEKASAKQRKSHGLLIVRADHVIQCERQIGLS